MALIETRNGKIYYDGAEVLHLQIYEYKKQIFADKYVTITEYYVRVKKSGDIETEWSLSFEEFDRLLQLNVLVQ